MGKRLTKEERARREAAYLVWRKHNLDFKATAQETGIEEKELKRWDRVHNWLERVIEEHRELEREAERIGDESERLIDLSQGRTPDGQVAFVSEEVRLLASLQAVYNNFAYAASHKQLELLKDAYLASRPDSIIHLAGFVHGIDRRGNPHPEWGSDARSLSRQILVLTGLVSDAEIENLSLDELMEVMRERLHQRGIAGPPQA